jgi:endonuclease/exonuclease/phosphatase family metal-dependent hydrolase
LALASLNLRWGQHTGGGEIALEPVLRELGADVVLLQEVWQPRAGPDTLAPARELGYEVVELAISDLGVLATRGFASSPAGAGGSWGLAVLSRLPVVTHATIPLGAVPLDPAGERAALQVTLAGAGGSMPTVVNVHLSHRPYGSPLQLRRLAHQLAARPPLVIGGDFNSFGVVSRTVLRRLRRTIAAPSWPAHRPLFGLDELYVAHDIDVLDSNVCGDVGSDHRPVRATVRLRPDR